MIIYITKSKLFTEDPAIRFAEQYHVKPKLFHELFRRYTLGNYDSDALCGYFQYKTGKKLHKKALSRWIFRGKVYNKSKPVVSMGVQAVSSSFFGPLETELVNELVKNMVFNGKKDARSVV